MGDAAVIAQPDTYRDGPPHELFTELRQRHPVVWVDMSDQPGYWAVLRHADVVRVARNSDLFSASAGGVVVEDLDEASLEQMRDMLLAMDPPRHTAYRRPLAPEFTARVMSGLEARIRAVTRSILDRADEHGHQLEFVHQVCAPLPSQVLGELLGLPEADWPELHRMAERNSGGQDPDIGTGDERGSASAEMAAYAYRFAVDRRLQSPQGDLTDILLGREFDGHLMSEIDFARFFVQLVTAGNDTTRTMLSSGLLALLEHPDQLDHLRQHPAAIPGAIEEILRWANPLHYFRRTATADTEINGVRIAAGDKVAMIYTSANRDELVFDNPQAFDIGRDPNPHLSFGIATHFCLGVHLARLEGRVFFEEVLSRWPGIALAGEPQRQRSNLNNSLKSLPITVGSS